MKFAAGPDSEIYALRHVLFLNSPAQARNRVLEAIGKSAADVIAADSAQRSQSWGQTTAAQKATKPDTRRVLPWLGYSKAARRRRKPHSSRRASAHPLRRRINRPDPRYDRFRGVVSCSASARSSAPITIFPTNPFVEAERTDSHRLPLGFTSLTRSSSVQDQSRPNLRIGAIRASGVTTTRKPDDSRGTASSSTCSRASRYRRSSPRLSFQLWKWNFGPLVRGWKPTRRVNPLTR